MLLRFEKKEDIKGIHSVHVESFETDQEAKLVDDLRLGDLDLISLVAEENQKIIGHILFSPVFLDSNIKIKMMGLAPLAILPTYQNRGIGTLLVRKGLDVCVQKKYNQL
jgi:putative acetyltransferase